MVNDVVLSWNRKDRKPVDAAEVGVVHEELQHGAEVVNGQVAVSKDSCQGIRIEHADKARGATASIPNMRRKRVVMSVFRGALKQKHRDAKNPGRCDLPGF